MNQRCFVLELAPAADGQVKRIHISYRTLACVFCGFLALGVMILAGCSSYLQMSSKVSHYNELRNNFERLRTRYQDLQRVSRQHTEQLASLETLASEVSVAYGLNKPAHAGNFSALGSNETLTPNVKDSMEQYTFLASATYGQIYHEYAHGWQTNARPSLWPVEGAVRSAFGTRNDPFSGEGVFHTGIDLAAARGTPVHVTADGVITRAGWDGGYGKLVVVDHGNGLETYYAHLSQFLVVPGQEVSRGEVIALSGGTGHSTGPHVHYEVRLHGTPLNPYNFLPHAQVARRSKPPVPSDLGLGL